MGTPLGLSYQIKRHTQASKMKTAALFTLALVLIAGNGASADCETLDSVLSQLASVDVEEIVKQYSEIAATVEEYINKLGLDIEEFSVDDVLELVYDNCPDV